MNDIVVMDLFAGKVIGKIEPDLVQQVDLLRRKPRSMRPEVKHLFVTRGRENLERDVRARFGHAFPSQADFPRLFGDSGLRRAACDDGAGLEVAGGAQDAFPEIVGGGNRKADRLALFRPSQAPW